MGGPHLEIFKFGVYAFFPVVVFYLVNRPEFYNNYVAPAKAAAFPPVRPEEKPPTDLEGIRAYRESYINRSKPNVA